LICAHTYSYDLPLLLLLLSCVLQPKVTVDAGTYEKSKVPLSSGLVSYPVSTWSKSGKYVDVVIDFSQDCTGLSAGCAQPTVDLSQLPPGVTHTLGGGNMTLTGTYAGINLFMSNLQIKPGAGNPHVINVMVTARDVDASAGTMVTDFDDFIIPVVSVSYFRFPLVLDCIWTVSIFHIALLTSTPLCQYLFYLCSWVFLLMLVLM